MERKKGIGITKRKGNVVKKDMRTGKLRKKDEFGQGKV